MLWCVCTYNINVCESVQKHLRAIQTHSTYCHKKIKLSPTQNGNSMHERHSILLLYFKYFILCTEYRKHTNIVWCIILYYRFKEYTQRRRKWRRNKHKLWVINQQKIVGGHLRTWCVFINYFTLRGRQTNVCQLSLFFNGEIQHMNR